MEPTRTLVIADTPPSVDTPSRAHRNQTGVGKVYVTGCSCCSCPNKCSINVQRMTETGRINIQLPSQPIFTVPIIPNNTYPEHINPPHPLLRRNPAIPHNNQHARRSQDHRLPPRKPGLATQAIHRRARFVRQDRTNVHGLSSTPIASELAEIRDKLAVMNKNLDEVLLLMNPEENS